MIIIIIIFVYYTMNKMFITINTRMRQVLLKINIFYVKTIKHKYICIEHLNPILRNSGLAYFVNRNIISLGEILYYYV